MIKANKKRKLSKAHREKLSLAKLGINNPMFGKKRPPFSAQTIKNMSESHLGIKLPTFSKTHKKRLSKAQKRRFKNPENHPQYGKRGRETSRYIFGQTPLTQSIRNSEEHKTWRITIFQRDNYVCQDCGKINCYLSAHHIKPFSKILEEFLHYYSQFSPIEDKETLVRFSLTWQEFWDINNGKTLCKVCHKKYPIYFLKKNKLCKNL